MLGACELKFANLGSQFAFASVIHRLLVNTLEINLKEKNAFKNTYTIFCMLKESPRRSPTPLPYNANKLGSPENAVAGEQPDHIY